MPVMIFKTGSIFFCTANSKMILSGNMIHLFKFESSLGLEDRILNCICVGYCNGAYIISNQVK